MYFCEVGAAPGSYLITHRKLYVLGDLFKLSLGKMDLSVSFYEGSATVTRNFASGLTIAEGVIMSFFLFANKTSNLCIRVHLL